MRIVLQGRRLVWPLVVIIATVMGGATEVHSQQLSRVVLMSPITDVVTGEPVELSLEVFHDGDTRVELPRLPDHWGAFDIEEQSVQITKMTIDGRLVTRQSIVVSLTNPGTFQTPFLPVTIRRETGSMIVETAEPVSLTASRPDETAFCD